MEILIDSFYPKSKNLSLGRREDSMKSRNALFTCLAVFAVAILLFTFSTTKNVQAKKSPPTPDVVGAWFGIARPCPANPTTDSAEHADFCTAVCGTCANAGILPPEFPMMPTLSDDGTMIADDSGEVSLYHTPGHGQWTLSVNDGLLDRTGTQRYKGTFLWLGQGPPSLGVLGNAVRTRFVTYSDPLKPDTMIGYIQPYFFPIAAGGVVVVNPSDPLDPLDGNHIPTIDPLVSPLPLGCDLTKGCLGTYHFIIRRIKED